MGLMVLVYISSQCITGSILSLLLPSLVYKTNVHHIRALQIACEKSDEGNNELVSHNKYMMSFLVGFSSSGCSKRCRSTWPLGRKLR